MAELRGDITYDELNELEEEFEDKETEIIRYEVDTMRTLYDRRESIVSRISGFWKLVFEQAPPEIDVHIQPQDSQLLLSHLKSLSVSRFEIEHGGLGDPRSLAIRFEFDDNEWLVENVIEKKFWYRRSRGGWSGLVSEPVDIKWKKGHDLTAGLLRLVKAVWDEESKRAAKGEPLRDPPTAEHSALKRRIDQTPLGGVSFFAWFGYVGRRISAEESRLATEKRQEQRRRRQQLGKDAMGGDNDDGDDDENKYEIFLEGDELAITIAEELWPQATKYFIQAQEQDLSSDEFESNDDIEEDDVRPPKKLARH